MSRNEDRPSSGQSASGHTSSGPTLEAKLVVVKGKASRSEIGLKLPARIGRGPNSSLLVKHRTISRSHCEIVERDGALVIRDLNSLNGTFVGDARVSEAILKPGDTFTIGPLTFRAQYHHTGQFPPLHPLAEEPEHNEVVSIEDLAASILNND